MSGRDILENLCGSLCRLPGIGRRSAERIAVRLVRDGGKLTRELIAVLQETAEAARCCSVCGAITFAEDDPCRLCTSPSRDDSLLCVVEEPYDIMMLERSGAFKGRYHALMGKISPMNGSGPSDLRLKALMKRAGDGAVGEVVLALSTDVEGDATATYIEEMMRTVAPGVRVTRLAFGLPAGSGIVYSDAVTLARAIKGRQAV